MIPAANPALDKLLAEEQTDAIHPRELDMLTGAEVGIYPVNKLFDKTSLYDGLELSQEGLRSRTPSPRRLVRMPAPTFYSPQLNRTSRSDMFQSLISTGPQSPGLAASLHTANFTSSVLTSTLVSETKCTAPGSPCAQLQDSLKEMRISVENLTKWTDGAAERQHELYHRLGRHLETAATCPGHHHHHCPPSYSGLLPGAVPNFHCEGVANMEMMGGKYKKDKSRDEEAEWEQMRRDENLIRKKGRDAEMRERRLKKAMFPKKLKPWESAARTAHLPSSSEDEISQAEPGLPRRQKRLSSRYNLDKVQQHLHLPVYNPYTPLPFPDGPDYTAVPWVYDAPASSNLHADLPLLPASDAEAAQDFNEEKPIIAAADKEDKKEKKKGGKKKRRAGSYKSGL